MDELASTGTGVPPVFRRGDLIGSFLKREDGMMAENRMKYSAAFKEEAVRLVIESSRPIAQVAREIHVNEGTLGNWVTRYRREHPVEELPLTISERARLKELEAENRELRMKAEFLGKAAAFFAQEHR
jgi:transposase-like protein